MSRWWFSLSTFNAILICLTIISVPAISHGSQAVPLAINLAGLHRWNTDWPLIDEMKRADIFTRKDFDPLEKLGDVVDWDDNGWPKSLTPTDGSNSFNKIEYVLFTANYSGNFPDGWDTAAPPAGVFRVMYDGEGTLSFNNSGTVFPPSCGTNCYLFEIDPDNEYKYVSITITETTADNHVRNIRVIWPGGLCDRDPFTWHHSAATCSGTYETFVQLENEVIFHPDYLKNLRDYDTIRFLNWQQINDSTVYNDDGTTDITFETEWLHRREPTYGTWVNGRATNDLDRLTPARGAPMETMISLVNTLGANAWLHIPYDASDEYIENFASLVKDSLGSSQRVYIEYGNEAWNSGWPFIKGVKYLIAKSVQAWGAIPIPPAAAYDHTFQYQMNYYAKRTTEVCSKWKTAWGADADRVTCVMGGQAANSGQYVDGQGITHFGETALECELWKDDSSNPNQGENCASQVDAVAIAPYFGGYIGGHEAVVTNWTLDDLFSEFNTGGLISASGSNATTNAPAGVSPLHNSSYHSPEALLALQMTAKLLNVSAQSLVPAGALNPPTTSPISQILSIPGAISNSVSSLDNTTGALDEVEGWIINYVATANHYGIDLLAYEGGQHLYAASIRDDDFNLLNPEIHALFIAANRDPRMGAAYIDYLNRWNRAVENLTAPNSSHLFTLYSSTTPANEHGSWGLQESLSQNSTPKLAATQQMINGTYCWNDRCSKLLSNAKWEQISLPCEPSAAENKVEDFFADDLGSSAHGVDWAIFSYDPVSNRYQNLSLTDTLSRGVGYWVTQLTGNSVDLDAPASCLVALPGSTNSICTATKGCFDVLLATTPAGIQWNLSGYGLDDALPFNRYTTGDSVPTLKIAATALCPVDGCLPDQAEVENLVHNQAWHYSSKTGKYELIEGESNLYPWDGFWIPTLDTAEGKSPTLVFPDY